MPDNSVELTPSQSVAMESLTGLRNVFLTGGAGTGKSFLIRHFHQDKDPKKFPILASTGAAAVIVGGRTFHSFFGLGIMEGGVAATIEKAVKNKRLVKRLQKIEGVVIDEVSMLSSETLQAAEEIARMARSSDNPWGGLQVIAVGDFAQLPPVQRGFGRTQTRDWAFLDPVWIWSNFEVVQLREQTRCLDNIYMNVLNQVRTGSVTDEVKSYLDSRIVEDEPIVDCTRLFPRKNSVSKFNLSRLNELGGESIIIESITSGQEKMIDRLLKSCPVSDKVEIKLEAFVMLLQNDPKGRFVNGSTGYVKDFDGQKILVELLDGRRVEVERVSFTMLDAEGEVIATLVNFPITLAWASTIHKSQGQTLDRAFVDLRRLWEPGQAYVAMSRVRSGDGLFLQGWDEGSILADSSVLDFYSSH